MKHLKPETSNLPEIHLHPTDYVHTDEDGRHITCTTLRQKAKHVVGLDRCCHNGRLYIRHGKRFYHPSRNYFAGRDKELDMLVEAGLMEFFDDTDASGGVRKEERVYWFTRKGLDWLGDELGKYIYDVER